MKFTIENENYKIMIEQKVNKDFSLLEVMRLIDSSVKRIGYYDSSMSELEYRKWEDAWGMM